MMDAAAAGLIGALGGAVIGLVGAVLIDVAQRRRALSGERRRAFASFLGALYPAVAELREMPPNRSGGLFERIDSFLLTDQAAWVRTRRGMTAISPHLFSRIDRLLAAIAILQVIDLPKEVDAAVDEAADYLERLGEHRSPELVGQWPAIHERLLDAADAL
jgi:hypothetical protein